VNESACCAVLAEEKEKQKKDKSVVDAKEAFNSLDANHDDV